MSISAVACREGGDGGEVGFGVGGCGGGFWGGVDGGRLGGVEAGVKAGFCAVEGCEERLLKV